MTYRERLWPGPLGWAMLVGAVAVTAVAVVPVGRTAVALTGALTAAVLAGGVWLTTPVVEVSDAVLRAGTARIPVDLLGRPSVLDRTGVRTALGPGSDARDFVLLRSWLPGAVSAPVLDPADPTPRWLICSRHPDQLAEALRAAQEAHSEHTG